MSFSLFFCPLVVKHEDLWQNELSYSDFWSIFLGLAMLILWEEETSGAKKFSTLSILSFLCAEKFLEQTWIKYSYCVTFWFILRTHFFNLPLKKNLIFLPENEKSLFRAMNDLLHTLQLISYSIPWSLITARSSKTVQVQDDIYDH